MPSKNWPSVTSVSTSTTVFTVAVQFGSVAQSYLTLCNPVDSSTLGFPVHHQLLEPTQTHVHHVNDTIQPSYPLVVPFSSCLQAFPKSGSFPVSHRFFTSGGQSIGVSASVSVLPVNVQYWLPLGWTGWISLQSKGLSGVFSNTTVQKHQFFGAQLSLQSQFSHPYMTTGKTIALTRWTFVGKVMSLLFNMLSSLVITFLPRSKCLFNFMAAITLCSDFGAQKVKSAILSTVSPSICFILFFIYSRRWVIEDLALIYVIKCSAYVFH